MYCTCSNNTQYTTAAQPRKAKAKQQPWRKNAAAEVTQTSETKNNKTITATQHRLQS
jgi:hypothetical protein